ncbi:MAG: hypothetical protein KAS93_04665 [Gammaproteobacteria bacterium]|nr:hypothetical protein [Gammaproteobacteria bacterium]
MLNKIIVLFLAVFILVPAFGKDATPKTSEVDWGKVGAPKHFTVHAVNKDKTCYDVIAFYHDAARSISVQYHPKAKHKKWIGTWGAWTCMPKK